MNLRQVNLAGRLTRDPELKTVGNDTQICKFGVAVNQYVKGGDDKAHFFDVTAFGKTAEMVNSYFAKGKEIFIEGQLEQQRWEKDGQSYSKVAVVAHKAHFVGPKGDQEAAKPATVKAGPPAELPDEDIPF